jgi:hypothetical protein
MSTKNGSATIYDFGAADQMIADLAAINAATGPRVIKQTLAVLTHLEFVSMTSGMETGAAQLVLDRLPPVHAEHYADIVRGMIVAGVAALRAAGMDNSTIEAWFDRQIAARKQFTLGFTKRSGI